ncbi:MAG: energy transducer TonB [Acidobacteria bacterium]|nr:energy transducer TonB [Acidobacteriota bacterium]
MLGLAIALSTFGLGVAATTLWIARHMPNVSVPVHSFESDAFRAESIVQVKTHDNTSPCEWISQKNAILNGGFLNSRGLPGETPTPSYPPIARAARASGIVVVQVLVDECGKVISARVASGHPLLQQAAVQAAYGWHFAPGLLGGEPAKIKGTLTFNFLLQ